MTISIDADKTEIQPLFMIKTSQKVGIEGPDLNTIKVIYNKLTDNIIINGQKLKAFCLRSKQDKGAHSHQHYST